MSVDLGRRLFSPSVVKTNLRTRIVLICGCCFYAWNIVVCYFSPQIIESGMTTVDNPRDFSEALTPKKSSASRCTSIGNVFHPPLAIKYFVQLQASTVATETDEGIPRQFLLPMMTPEIVEDVITEDTQRETADMDTVSNISIYDNSTDINETSTMVADTNTTLAHSADAAPSSGIDPKDIEMISYVTVPLFFVLGLGGNISSITTMQTKSFRKSTICIYLTALALSDTTFILVGPFTKSFMKDIFGRDPKALTEAGCKIFFWVFRSAKICSSWFVVTICIERFIVVWFPLRAKIISTRRTAAISVLTVTSLVLTFDGIWTITTGIVNGACLPTVVTESTKDLSAAFVIAGTAIFNIIPTCVLLLFTPLTAFKLFRQQSFRREMNVSAINADAMRVTRMLVSISCAYIILVTPISVAHSVAFFNGDNIFESTNPRFIVFREFAQILEQLNYCVNFFLYITFNVTFRQSFFGIFKCGRTNDVTRNVIAGSPDDVDKKSLKSSSSSSSTTNTSLTPDVLG